MWISIINSLIALAITTVLFMPQLRAFPLYRPLSFYFLFEGSFSFISLIVTQIWGSALFLAPIHDIGNVLLSVYILVSALQFQNQPQKSKGSTNFLHKPK